MDGNYMSSSPERCDSPIFSVPHVFMLYLSRKEVPPKALHPEHLLFPKCETTTPHSARSCLRSKLEHVK